MLKSTYGTGCFMIANTGAQRLQSDQRLLSTLAYRMEGQVTYALEGAIFNVGTAIQWLRDNLKLFSDASETQAMAEQAKADNVYMVPAFTGLGAPWWDANARGVLCGLTRDTGPNEIVRAALEAAAYQTADLTRDGRRRPAGQSYSGRWRYGGERLVLSGAGKYDGCHDRPSQSD